MNYMTFFNHIQSKSLSGAYILHGEEEFVKENALRSLVNTMDDVTRQLNLTVIEPKSNGEQLSAEELISLCDELPFFAERRIVISRSIPMAGEAKKVTAYLPGMPSTTLLIFFIRGSLAESGGRKKELPAFVKVLQKIDAVVEFAGFSQQEVVRWVMQHAKKLEVSITEQSARYLVNLTGTDMTSVNNELSKAAGYAGAGNEITKEDISACVTRSLEVRIFDMIDYFTAGKAQDGLRAYRHMLSDGESPMGIAVFMENRFRDMLLARSCIDKGLNRNSTLQHMGSTFPAKKAYDAALKYSRQEIIDSIRRFADVGYLQISGQQQDSTALEDALIRCLPRRR